MVPNWPIYVAWVGVDPAVVDKLQQRSGGGCTVDEAREAVVRRLDADLRWEDHPEYGRRVVGTSTTFAGRLLFVALWPIDPTDGTWMLMTAFPL